MQRPATDLRNDRSHQSRKRTEDIVRHPRRTAEDVVFYRTARRIAKLEKRARKWIARSINFIARGREANIQLGRIFIRLKGLVGHGHFEKYYERKFWRPYGVAFRTAEVYMRLAREADKIKTADPALFPLAKDPQAVEIREATERHRGDVARAKRSSSEEAASDDDTKQRGHAKDPEGSMCTFRLQIRISRENYALVLALWRSEHRALAESAVTEFLLALCAKYEIDGSASKESDE